MARNKRGQVTRTGNIEIKLSKRLLNIADEAAIRIRPLVRDELVRTLRAEIYASYTPATKQGQNIKEYNETHKHQKTRLYHHTGRLADKIHGTIEGNIVTAGPIEGAKYDDGTLVTDVYHYLKFGTTNKPKKSDVYSYDKGQGFSHYIAQEPHNFEARTTEWMDKFIDNLADELQTEAGKKKYIGKYLNKRI